MSVPLTLLIVDVGEILDEMNSVGLKHVEETRLMMEEKMSWGEKRMWITATMSELKLVGVKPLKEAIDPHVGM